MTHPEELLADYVDGTLDDEQRAVVDAHLPGCETCRDEIELARGAVAALASLEDEPVPFGVTGPVLAEAGRRFERRRVLVWERLQWAAGLAAAAALVLVVALNIGNGSDREDAASLGSSTAADGQVEAPEGGAAETALAFAFQGLEVQDDVNYVADGISSLATVAAEVISGRAPAETGGDQRYTPADEALACIEQSGAPTVDDPRDTLMRLIEAEYEGTPAYIAVYAESPGAGQPADTVVVWAVAKSGCQILTTASLRV